MLQISLANSLAHYAKMAEPLQVLVVGAGPVGLSAALALARRGAALRIVESGSTVDRRMRASTFHPPTLDMIDGLGLSAPLVGLGLKAPRWQMRQHETGKQVTFDLALLEEATAHPYRLQVEQHRYCALVIDRLRDIGVPVEFGTRIQALDQDTNGVTVRTGHGEDIRADFVLGADGASSAVRKSLGLNYDGETHAHGCILVSTDFPFHERLNGLVNINDCWSIEGPFSLLRMKDHWRVSLNHGDEDLAAAAAESAVRKRLAGIHPEAGDAKLLGIAPYRVHERCVSHFRLGRVLLAGDAAHLNPPMGGMGMNCGIHDAFNAAAKLGDVLDGADDTLLDRYDRQRRQVAYERVIPQTSAQRSRMDDDDGSAHARRLARYRAIAADRRRCREFLLATSMISALCEAETID